MFSKIDPRLLLVCGALLFSTGGAAIKATTMSGWQIAAFRSGIAGLALLVMLPPVRRHITWRVLLVSVAYAAMLTLYVLANKLTTAANTIFLQSTAPLYVLTLSPFLLREHLHKRDIWFMLALAVGLSLFFVSVDTPSATAPAPLMGNILAGLAGFCWGLTLLGLRWLAKSDGAESAAAAATAGNLLTFVVCAYWAFPVVGTTPIDWLVMIYLGVFQIGFAYVLVTAAMPKVTALEASLLLLVEPVFNPLWAWCLLGESPSLLASIAGTVILVSIIINTVQKRSG